MPRSPSRAPDDQEFTALVHRCWPTLYRTAYLLVGSHAGAEDLTQAALAQTYAHWHRIRSADAAPAYARRTLVNTATSWFRRRSWNGERPTESLPEPRDGAIAAPAAITSPEAGVDRIDLARALGHLPPRQRAVVVLRFYEDLSVAATAEALRVSEGTVKSQTSAALAKLRDLLGVDVDASPTAHDAIGDLR